MNRRIQIEKEDIKVLEFVDSINHNINKKPNKYKNLNTLPEKKLDLMNAFIKNLKFHQKFKIQRPGKFIYTNKKNQ